MKLFFLMALVQLVSYTNLVVNYRAIAKGRSHMACVTDVAASAISFFIIKSVADAEGYWALAGMMVGGGAASYLGIWMTRHWDTEK